MSAVNIELLPCPFCGGEARPMCALDESTKQITYTVMCMSCSTAIFHPRMSVFEWDAYDTEEEAAAAWNTRHVETCTIGDYKDPDYGYTHDAMWNDEWFVPSGRCSCCGEYIPVWNYCPKCGRKVVDE